jgi:protein phosphatase
MTRSTLGSGSLASDLAAKAVAAAWNPAAGTDSAWLERTLTAAHRHIVEKSRTLLAEGPRDGASRLLPMGTTAVLAVVEGNRAVVASVGDSRAYLFDPKFGLMLLTHEHTQANRLLSEGTSWAEVRNREDRATIVSALGSCRLAGDRLQEEPLEVSKAEFTLAPGELLLLCTDGFTDALGRASAKKGRWDAERELERLISELCGRGLSLKQLVEQLASEADARAGDDNITLVAFSLDETPPGAGASTGSEGDNRSRGQTGVRRSRERRAN